MKDFLEYLKNEKRKADNTILAYRRDLESFEAFLEGRNGRALADCTESDAMAYVMELGNNNKSKATINRKISALRTYCDYNVRKGIRTDNPFNRIKAAKNDKRQIEYLTVDEVKKLLESTDDSVKGLRDRALMEFMYGTGARVTEVVRLKYEDINLRMNFATIKEYNAESRIVPIGRYAHDALVEYIDKAYPVITGRAIKPGDYLFLNQMGKPLTRQGIWKILKDYGDVIGTADKMTPQVLRDSFAVHILQNGGDLKTLQELMGFDDMSVGIAYLAVTDIHVKEVFTRTHPRA
ncbi:MAG: tyrosine-type recombinase/integrase [Clostridiales bacterium]|nr:tyrosine-type recombinase/integrase [Candidatus Crickella merdequi]